MSPPAHSLPQLDLDALRSEIRVFPVMLDDTPAGSSSAGAFDPASCHWLSADELARARAFTAPRAHSAFVQCRALLRRLLAEYLKQPAVEPRLHVQQLRQARAGRVSLSSASMFRTHARWRCWPSRWASSVGVDIERDEDGCSTRWRWPGSLLFAERSPRCCARCRRSKIDAAFLACWTRKEAMVKALGISLGGTARVFLRSSRCHAGAAIGCHRRLAAHAPQLAPRSSRCGGASPCGAIAGAADRAFSPRRDPLAIRRCRLMQPA
jgi:phosphopantetheinyl transferase